jgi:hypothetical protein
MSFLGERFHLTAPDEGRRSSTPNAIMFIDPFNFRETFSPTINLSIPPSSSARAKYLPQWNLERRNERREGSEERERVGEIGEIKIEKQCIYTCMFVQ